MINVRVRDRDLYAMPLAPITSGSVGLQVRFAFDAVWENLTKTAVFKGSGTTEAVTLTENTCEVPAEVLETPGDLLWIGVYGVNDNETVVIPTVWGKAGYIYEGAAVPETI